MDNESTSCFDAQSFAPVEQCAYPSYSKCEKLDYCGQRFPGETLGFTRNVFIQNFFFFGWRGGGGGGGGEGIFKIIVLFLLSDVEHSCLPGSLHSVRIKTKSLLKS